MIYIYNYSVFQPQSGDFPRDDILWGDGTPAADPNMRRFSEFFGDPLGDGTEFRGTGILVEKHDEKSPIVGRNYVNCGIGCLSFIVTCHFFKNRIPRFGQPHTHKNNQQHTLTLVRTGLLNTLIYSLLTWLIFIFWHPNACEETKLRVHFSIEAATAICAKDEKEIVLKTIRKGWFVTSAPWNWCEHDKCTQNRGMRCSPPKTLLDTRSYQWAPSIRLGQDHRVSTRRLMANRFAKGSH